MDGIYRLLLLFNGCIEKEVQSVAATGLANFLRSACTLADVIIRTLFIILLICFSYFAADTQDGPGCAHHQLTGCKKNNKKK